VVAVEQCQHACGRLRAWSGEQGHVVAAGDERFAEQFDDRLDSTVSG